MKKILILAILIVNTSVNAATITITLSDDEQKGLITLLDQAVRAEGLQVAEPALYLFKRIQQEQKKAIKEIKEQKGDK